MELHQPGGGADLDDYVVGPAVAVDGNVVLFDTTTGKLIKDGGSTSSFETVAKNLKAYPAVFSCIGDVLNTITYDLGDTTSIVKTFNYTGDTLDTIVLSGNTPGGITLTKTFTYSGTTLTTITYS